MSLSDQLAEPFPASDIEWRLQQAGEKNGRIWAKVLAYVTNRAIMDRLDAVVGPERWQNRYEAGPSGGVVCFLSIESAGQWITKVDGAENTDVEPVKGGLSNAMKRAAVQWGIGRYLYHLEEGWAQIDEQGPFSGKTKEGKYFKWNPPTLPAWALPGGSGKPDASANPSVSAPRAGAVSRAPVGGVTALDPASATEAPAGGGDSAPPVCPKCSGAMWDNRVGKRNPRSPDYKCRDRTCDGIIWPPKPAVNHA